MTNHPVAALACLLTLAACASVSTPTQPALAKNPDCLAQTGSRLAASNAPCTSTGASYSQEDIRRTGKTSAADALQMLDPSVTVRH